MKTKNLLIGLFAVLLLSMTLASAAIISVTDSGPFHQNNNQVVVTITSDVNQTVQFSMENIFDENDLPIDPADPDDIDLIANVPQTVNLTALPNYEYLKIGKIYAGDLKVTDSVDPADTRSTEIVFIKTFCELGAVDETDLVLDVKIDNKGEGEDSEWLPRDRIEIDVDFENDKEDELQDVIFQLGLLDTSSGKNVADELEWISKKDEEIEIGDFEDGDSEEHTFEFIIPTDLDDGDYMLVVKAYPQGEETVTCVDYTAEGGLEQTYLQMIDVNKESDDERLIIFEDIKVTPTPAPCGIDVVISATAYNIGEEDQDAVKISLYNSYLEVDTFQVIEDFDIKDAPTVEFTITVPKDAEEKMYTFTMFSRYDYDEDDDEEDGEVDFDDNAFEEKSGTTKAYLTVEGNCLGAIEDVEIDAALSEDTPKAVIGKEVIVEATIENTGDTEATYDISVSGVSDWATASVEPSEVTLAAGESEIVLITLDVDSDAEAGDQEFSIITTSGEKSAEQDVLLELEEGGFFAASSVAEHFKDKWFIYTVIIVDIILIVAIVIAVRRMIRKRPSSSH